MPALTGGLSLKGGTIMNNEECKKEELTFAEIVSTVMTIFFGVFTLVRGIYFINNRNNENEIQLYYALTTVFPLWVWGIILLIGSISLILSAFVLPKRSFKKRYYYYLFFGGLTTSVTYFVIAIAGFNQAQAWLTPLQMIILSTLGGFLAFFGGVGIWKTRNSKTGS